MAEDQKECSRLEQRPVIKVLMVEKCKPCGIYRRMCNVYKDICFSKKNPKK